MDRVKLIQCPPPEKSGGGFFSEIQSVILFESSCSSMCENILTSMDCTANFCGANAGQEGWLSGLKLRFTKPPWRLTSPGVRIPPLPPQGLQVSILLSGAPAPKTGHVSGGGERRILRSGKKRGRGRIPGLVNCLVFYANGSLTG